MKLKLLIACMVITALSSCKSRRDRIEEPNVIDVEYAFENLVTLKVSDFGKTIRYIPLETSDNCFVGNAPIVKVLKNHIIIHNRGSQGDNCLVFDKKDGSFITTIGRKGQSLKEFGYNKSWIDEKEEFLYFIKEQYQLVKYDIKGNFCGNVTFSAPPGLASSIPPWSADNYVLTDSLIIGRFNNASKKSSSAQFALGIFDSEGQLIDTIPHLFPSAKTEMAERKRGRMLINLDGIPLRSLTEHVYRERYLNTVGGILANAGFSSNSSIYHFKNGDRQLIIQDEVPGIWINGENIRYKEEFVDTIYTYSNGKLLPSFTFHTGKYHWPLEEIRTKRITNEWLYIAGVCESNTFIFFQCIGRALTDESVLYNGLYNKKTGETKLGKNSDGIEDDLTHFMPFIPYGISTAGEFFSRVDSWQVMEWLEEHPEALANEKLSSLKELDGESNPVVILVE